MYFSDSGFDGELQLEVGHHSSVSQLGASLQSQQNAYSMYSILHEGERDLIALAFELANTGS